jgi:ABC-type Zn2+ transport system substrate-binding protein/surface adhesin
MTDERTSLIQRLTDLGVSEKDWLGMDEMTVDALRLLLESVEQHREMWVSPGDAQDHQHQHDHAPGEPHQPEHTHDHD